jgi:propionyl-CoA carboxylase beta chain
MFVTGPDVISTVTHEEVTKEELGGATTHNTVSGVAHFIAPNDEECLRMMRRLLHYIPQNNRDEPPRRPTTDPWDREDPSLDTIVPAQSNVPYAWTSTARSRERDSCGSATPSRFRS